MEKNFDGDGPLPTLAEIKTMRREINYLREITTRTMSRMLVVDTQSVAIRHELEQKRRGFKLMAELAVTMTRPETAHESVFVSVCRRINTALNMQRTVVLGPTEDENRFGVFISQGYTLKEQKTLLNGKIRIPDKTFLDPAHPVIITGATPEDYVAPFREALSLPFLISSPVVLNNKIMAVLVTGRLDEQMPFLPRLGSSDVETVLTVCSYLAAMLANRRFEEVEDMANQDPLTHLANLRHLKERLRQLLTLARRNGTLVAVLFIDLDDFKIINDTYGHAAGDIVLRTVAERLMCGHRESDVVGRVGGDEFVVVLSNLASTDDAAAVAKKILEKLSQPINANGAVYHVGASIGVSIFPDDAQDEFSLLKAADTAMYSVKKTGKNMYADASSATE